MPACSTPECLQMPLAEYLRWQESNGITENSPADDKSIVKRWIELVLAEQHKPTIWSDNLIRRCVSRPANEHPKAPDHDRSRLRQWFRWWDTSSC